MDIRPYQNYYYSTVARVAVLRDLLLGEAEETVDEVDMVLVAVVVVELLPPEVSVVQVEMAKL
jgi:hypothetical protein